MSFWNRPTVAAKNAVVAPMKVTKASAIGACSNIGEQRQTRNTPAVTMVAAWIRAETGVGPSIASGSQVCSRNWADLPIAPTNSSRHSVVMMSTLWPANTKVLPAMRGRGGEHGGEIQRAEDVEDAEDAQREAEIADAVDDEGLDRGGVGRGLRDTRSRSADRRRAPRLPSRRTSAGSCWPSPASAWRR